MTNNIAFDGSDDHEGFSPSALRELNYSGSIPISFHIDTEGSSEPSVASKLSDTECTISVTEEARSCEAAP